MIDLLHAVDWVVDEPRPSAERVSSLLGLPPVDDRWHHHVPSHRYEAVFTQAAALVDSPTRLEFIRSFDGSQDRVCSLPPLRAIEAMQGTRRQKTHATVFCVDDFEAYTEELQKAGLDVWVEPPCEHLPQPRGWIGWTDGGRRHVGGVDPGLYLEFIPTGVLGQAVQASIDRPRRQGGPATARRVHLVEDLDAAVRMLSRVGAEPARPVAAAPELGGRVARYEFRHPGSAALELLEPEGDGPAARYAAAWGPGPWLTSIAVDEPDEVAAEAADNGAARADVDALPIVELWPGVVVELVEADG